jgi:hypothetical protein
MGKIIRHYPSICIGLVCLSINLFGLAAWRYSIYWSASEKAFLRYRPPPRQAEYTRRSLTDAITRLLTRCLKDGLINEVRAAQTVSEFGINLRRPEAHA